MGEIIRKDAAVGDIVSDVRESHTRAKARGGVWAVFADQKLAPAIGMIDTVAAKRADATVQAAPLLAALDVARDGAGDLVGRIRDDLWNTIGRPASDAAFSVLFPGGSSFYTDGDVAEQPDRMDLLVELLEAGIHPRIPPAKAQAAAAEVKAGADGLRAAVTAAWAPRTKVQLYERAFAAVARVAAIELAGFKRLLKAEGFGEADIHAVIPDRTRPAPKKAPENAPAPSPDPTPPA